MRRESLGRILLQLRYDQLVLGSMAAILGVTVIFACGVERGKVLVRVERSILVRQPPAVPAVPQPTVTAELPVPPPAVPAAAPSTGVGKRATDKPAQAPGPKVKTRVVSAPAAVSGKSRYAVQVVTFTRAGDAKQEMDRLHARGERAFLVMREGRTVVYVGPFPSKSNAAEKVSTLKSRYQDCFVRTL